MVVMADRAGAIAQIQEARRLKTMRLGGVEEAYRAALALDPAATPATMELADLLRLSGRAADALAVTQPALKAKPANHGVLVAHAESQKLLGDMEGAAETFRRASKENPASAVALHNLAGALGDLERFEEAEARARQAMKAGLDAPQTWAVLARALQGLGKLDEAETAYRAAITREPTDADTQRDLAQLIWMRTGDIAVALNELDREISARSSPRLLETKAIAAKFMGDLRLARETIDVAVRSFPDPASRVTAAHLAILDGDPQAGLAYARMAIHLQPGARWMKLSLAEALLANGEAREAASIVEALHAAEPFAQDVIAYIATAWRLLGDARYEDLYDYGSLIQVSDLATPKGWPNLTAYMDDLTTVLQREHVYRTHPFQQSVRHGSQINNLVASRDPVVQALFEALQPSIDMTLDRLGAGGDPVRSRNTGAARFQGAWSVRLGGNGGRHVSHVHPKGWLSSACYIDLPQSIGGEDERDGWLTFGEPGIATQPRLPAQWFVKPERGRLVLFPSYMWHATNPFAGDEDRLSVAFDLVPALKG